MSPADDGVDAIAGICRSLGVKARVAQLQMLADYLALLARWNRVYNLTAVRDAGEALVQHIADCVAVVPALQRHGVSGRRILDVGSGGGLPGVVISILLPETDVTCVDSVGKKAAFIRQVASALSLPNLRAVHGRVETDAAALGRHSLVTSRAFASLAEFVRMTRERLTEDGCWMAMKGRTPVEEIDLLPSGVEMFHVEQLAVPGMPAERCLVWIRPSRSSGSAAS